MQRSAPHTRSRTNRAPLPRRDGAAYTNATPRSFDGDLRSTPSTSGLARTRTWTWLAVLGNGGYVAACELSRTCNATGNGISFGIREVKTSKKSAETKISESGARLATGKSVKNVCFAVFMFEPTKTHQLSNFWNILMTLISY